MAFFPFLHNPRCRKLKPFSFAMSRKFDGCIQDALEANSVLYTFTESGDFINNCLIDLPLPSSDSCTVCSFLLKIGRNLEGQ